MRKVACATSYSMRSWLLTQCSKLIRLISGVKNTSRQRDWDTNGWKRGNFFSDTYSKTNFQFRPFPSNPTGKAPPSRGRSVLKKEENEQRQKKTKILFWQHSKCAKEYINLRYLVKSFQRVFGCELWLRQQAQAAMARLGLLPLILLL